MSTLPPSVLRQEFGWLVCSAHILRASYTKALFRDCHFWLLTLHERSCPTMQSRGTCSYKVYLFPLVTAVEREHTCEA